MTAGSRELRDERRIRLVLDVIDPQHVARQLLREEEDLAVGRDLLVLEHERVLTAGPEGRGREQLRRGGIRDVVDREVAPRRQVHVFPVEGDPGRRGGFERNVTGVLDVVGGPATGRRAGTGGGEESGDEGRDDQEREQTPHWDLLGAVV
ncbi:MAG: hypothetical protein M3238_08060 [Actinomycetota bacterium]|nr:hypothetical protein [Actinomycetota bacterium]